MEWIQVGEWVLVILVFIIAVFIVLIWKDRKRFIDVQALEQTKPSKTVTRDRVKNNNTQLFKEKAPEGLSPMDMTPEEAKATALPFQEPIVVRKEIYRKKIHTEPIPETENIDTDCFAYFKGASVLVVEDNMINQKIITSVLKKGGILVDVANNGKEALEKLARKSHYDLIIMDISMPEMDGIEATTMIRQNPKYDAVPIVTFTAFNLGPEIRRMFEAGANAYLTKPLNINQLYTVFTLFVGNPKEEVEFKGILELHGLDIQEGLEHFEGDEEEYRLALERFKHRYALTPELFKAWMEHENYDRAKVELRDLYGDAVAIGAYDAALFLKEMQKYFIYHNEHLLPRHLLMFKTKLQTLFDAIDLYLASQKQAENHPDLTSLNNN